MSSSHRRSRGALAAAALLVPLTVTACGAGAEPELTAEEQLAAAKAALDDSSGVRIGLNADELPKGVSGLISAEGVGTHDPAFDGEIKVVISGLSANVPVVAVDGLVYARLPFTQKFSEVDPASYGAPDPADLMDTEGGLSSLLTSAEDVEEGEQVRDGEDVLSEFTGTVPGDAVAAVIPSASADADFEAAFRIDDSDRLRQVMLTGPFYPKADDVTYTVDLDEYGLEKDITAP